MSTLYNIEPNPTAKAILHTTSGDLLIELFAQQCPLATRSFLQHILDGYYTGSIFHRLVPGFIVQGGDPTGTGFGGESGLSNGQPFQDELHSRLKFNRRGLLGMANGGKKNDNGSQFFFTLGETKELNEKHTMFGRIQGDTIFNLLRMGEAELVEGEGADRPMFPTKITDAEILVNPFEDMVARIREVERVVEDKPITKKRKRKPAGRQMMSFVGEDDDLEDDDLEASVPRRKWKGESKETTVTAKIDGPDVRRSAHVMTAAKSDDIQEVPKRSVKQPSIAKEDDERSQIPSRAKPKANVHLSPDRAQSIDSHGSHSESDSDEPQVTRSVQKSAVALSEANAEIAALKASLKRNGLAETKADVRAKPKSALEAMIPATSQRGRKRGGGDASNTGTMTKDQQKVMDGFMAFGKKLADAAAQETTASKNGGTTRPSPNGSRGVDDGHEDGNAVKDAIEEDAPWCDLHFVPNCESCRKWDAADAAGNEDDEDERVGLMTHRLTFEKDRKGKDLEWKRQNEKELEVLDPLERSEIHEEDAIKGKRKSK